MGAPEDVDSPDHGRFTAVFLGQDDSAKSIVPGGKGKGKGGHKGKGGGPRKDKREEKVLGFRMDLSDLASRLGKG